MRGENAFRAAISHWQAAFAGPPWEFGQSELACFGNRDCEDMPGHSFQKLVLTLELIVDCV